jgi:replication factor C subunit 2/4
MDFFNKTKNICSSKNLNIKLPWTEKYRPKNSEEILLEPFIKEKLNKILENKSIPNMIITGEPGTGKTSTILFMAKQIYNNTSYYNENVLELNASDDRGLAIINNTIYPFCKKKINKKFSHKLVILDEADSITSKAQNLLSNIISEFRNNTRFVFICNDCSQIIEAIQSRCMIIKYPKINSDYLYSKIENICINENIHYTEESINTLLFVSDKDIRQSINNLECIYYALGSLTVDNIYKLIDKPRLYYINIILNHCLKNNYTDAINSIIDLYNKGYTPNDILLTFMKFLFEDSEHYIELDEPIRLKIYDILSTYYIRINAGVDTILQLCGCISKIFLYLHSNKLI